MFQSFNSSLRPFHTAMDMFKRPLTEETFDKGWDVLLTVVNTIEYSAIRSGYTYSYDSPYGKPMAKACSAFNLIAYRPEYVGDGRYVYTDNNVYFFNHRPVKAETIRKRVLSLLKEAEQAYARMVY